MVSFRINLLKNQAVPQPVRRKIYLAISAYIALCGCILVLLSYRAAIHLQSSFRARAEIARMEARFRAQIPGSTDIVMYGRTLSRKLAEMSTTVQSLNAACETRVELARILLALSAPLPPSVNIKEVEMNQSQQFFEFEVDFPIAGSGETIDASKLLRVWNSNPVLKAQVGRIHSLRSQKRIMQGRSIENWRFAGSRLTGGR